MSGRVANVDYGAKRQWPKEHRTTRKQCDTCFDVKYNVLTFTASGFGSREFIRTAPRNRCLAKEHSMIYAKKKTFSQRLSKI